MTSNRYPAPADPRWMLRGICTDVPDLMAPREDDPDGIAQARRICSNCPVAVDCLNTAMRDEAGAEAHDRDGIRGGYTPTERWSAYRQRRPPKKKELQPCGTKAAYRRHQDRGEDPCPDCHQAMLDEAQERRDAKRAQKAKERAAAKCGTPGGHQAHRDRQEEACGPCREAKKPGPAAKPIEHGTRQGAFAHKNRGIPCCEPCREKYAEAQREYRAARKAAAEATRHRLAA